MRLPCHQFKRLMRIAYVTCDIRSWLTSRSHLLSALVEPIMVFVETASDIESVLHHSLAVTAATSILGTKCIISFHVVLLSSDKK